MIRSAQTYWSLDSPRPNHLELRRWKYWTLPTCSVGLCAFKASRYPLNLRCLKHKSVTSVKNSSAIICTPLNFACHRKTTMMTRQDHKTRTQICSILHTIFVPHAVDRLLATSDRSVKFSPSILSSACNLLRSAKSIASVPLWVASWEHLPPPDRNLAATVAHLHIFQAYLAASVAVSWFWCTPGPKSAIQFEQTDLVRIYVYIYSIYIYTHNI